MLGLHGHGTAYVDLTEPKLSFCQLRGTGQACISLVTTRVSEPQGKPKGVQV
ncbi:hypothetical protein NXW27_09835 [Phocaeicola dorei]|nr:hypothetical protein [Phocaeicola dorei]MCS3154346.1 hypothetical protein [Phocaeicola dorei]